MENIRTIEELQIDIKAMLKEKNGILLAHNYQRDEVQEIANFTGDSLELSIKASETDADIIVFCGVHFMAESAAILSPEKTVLLPKKEAGCALASQINPDKIADIRNSIGDEVPIATYVNTTAAVKALSDICFTSANAAAAIKSLNAKKVFVAPDKNLANWIAKQLPEIEIEIFEGGCPVHQVINSSDLDRAKSKWPDAVILAHPECSPGVVDAADHTTSTSGMYRFAKSSSQKRFIICTENGILYRLRKENPDKEFMLANDFMICPNMKMTSLEDIYESIENIKGVITVPEDTRLKARKVLNRMLAVPRSN